MKIRLGNDVRLKIQLPVGSQDGDKAIILSARAFFINSTLKEELQKKYIKKNRFIGRFPIEPFVDEFEPTAYNINSIGLPKYRAFVRNEYNGFGINPNWKDCMPIKEENITVYESQVERTGNPNIVIVTFPAIAQKYAGEYELIITGQIYDEGYANNSRTVTVNTKKVFELVTESSQEEGLDSPVFLEINNAESDITPKDVYVVGGRYNNNSIVLTRNDDTSITVDMSPLSSWYYGE